MEGTYWLRRQTGRWARFARVTVQAEVAAEPAVRLGAEVFGGRGRSFGAEVGVGSAEWDRFRAEAREGAWYALMSLPEEARGVLVSVVGIVTAPADTGAGDVKFAAAHAVWRAVGREPGRWPWIDADGNPVFPVVPVLPVLPVVPVIPVLPVRPG